MLKSAEVWDQDAVFVALTMCCKMEIAAGAAHSRHPLAPNARPRHPPVFAILPWVLQQLQLHIQMKKLKLKYRWILHYDNAQPHITKIVKAWLASK